ncbi:MAG: transcriptional regulator [Deltaproteobacteria bacterium]|nr:transcriptional regulator [Deltaproteobacteria bacterium]
MHEEHEAAKTLGRQSARLVTVLHEQGRTLFTHADVQGITGLAAKSARNLVAGLVNRGLATRLKPGLFILVPFELGRERDYLGNPYVVARELADTSDYYLSHASAMDLHQMVTQPQLAVFVTSPKAIRPRTVLGTEFRFVRCKAKDLFGIAEHWATKTERVRVSDLERTVIDGLKQPEHCGGFTEVAKGFWMRREAISPGKLADYALQIDVGAVVRRLGFLLETFEVPAVTEVERLRATLTSTYALLDPLMPAEGSYQARWRLRVNVAPDELHALVRT